MSLTQKCFLVDITRSSPDGLAGEVPRFMALSILFSNPVKGETSSQLPKVQTCSGAHPSS